MASMTDKLLVRLLPELKDLVAAEALRRKVFGGMGEVVVEILAAHFDRPDLAKVPREIMGRPPKVKRVAVRS